MAKPLKLKKIESSKKKLLNELNICFIFIQTRIQSAGFVFICFMIFFISCGYILPINKAKSMALLPYSKVPS
jgi:hypothetical protein